MTPNQNSNVIAAVFDDLSSANEAIDRLVSGGISPAKIELLTGPDAIAFAETKQNGFWTKIALFFFDEDRKALLRDLHRGGCLLVFNDLEFDEDDLALGILDDDDLTNAGDDRLKK